MIDEAIKIAKKSKSESHRVGCVITNKKGKIISIGFNSETKTHPEQAKFALMNGEINKIFLHAEIHALVRCRDNPYTIHVARLTKGGNVGIAKPCPICQLAIKKAKIKKVIYTNKKGGTSQYEL